MGLFGNKWKPATGVLIDTRDGGKHGDWSGNDARSVNSLHYLSETYEAELNGGPSRANGPDKQAPPPGGSEQ